MSCNISIVVPCFNHGEFLPEAVASVTCVNRDDVELIVVDDGSTDNRTCEVMRALIDQGIKVIRQENKGLAAARNAGISVSKGKYVLPLDADNRVRTGYFEHGIRILDDNPQVGVVYGDAQRIGTRTDRWCVGALELDQLLQENYIDACAVYRRVIWEQNCGYDGTMPVQGYEDWDLWLGALEQGWQFEHVSEILFDYRVSEQSMLTRARGSLDVVQEFVARKHGVLYRRAFLEKAQTLQAVTEKQQSVRWTARNLSRLLQARLVSRLGIRTSDGNRTSAQQAPRTLNADPHPPEARR